MMMKKKSSMALNDMTSSLNTAHNASTLSPHNKPPGTTTLQSHTSMIMASPPVMLKHLYRKQSVRLSVLGTDAVLTTKISDLNNLPSTTTTANNSMKMMGHVPYLNSKLTHFLKDSLGGIGKTLMILNCATMNESYHQTVCVYEYAARSRKCMNFPLNHMFEISSTLENMTSLANHEINILRQLKAKLYAPPAIEKKPLNNNNNNNNNKDYNNSNNNKDNNNNKNNNANNAVNLPMDGASLLASIKQKSITLTIKQMRAEEIPYLYFPLIPFISMDIGNVIHRTAP
jgi:hypothetical protein